VKFIIGQDAPTPTVNTWLEDRKNGFAVMMRATDGKVQTVAELEVGLIDGLTMKVRRVHDQPLCDALGIIPGALAIPMHGAIDYEAPSPARYPASPPIAPAPWTPPAPAIMPAVEELVAPAAKEPWHGVEVAPPVAVEEALIQPSKKSFRKGVDYPPEAE
jgi:hypothetical protein